ncbi:MAG: sigma-70 family RNA polymerase sigma factor [Phycisphaerales bacterium]|nr:MAG: sigma-70 family RNA polymerase sigma factor [Phycisphaerales bacterium]
MVKSCAGTPAMADDKVLLRRLQQGDQDALQAIYAKYEATLLALAANLLDEPALAEDVLQDVLVTLVQSVHRLRIRRSLKGYLATAVANRARDYYRRKPRQQFVSIDQAGYLAASEEGPFQMVIRSEQVEKARAAMVELPYEQREAIVLRLHADMKFREIAKVQHVSVKTALSRYRYGLDKLRAMLNGEVRDERD